MNSFFEPELRSGYLVSSEIKKLWSVQLDLLKQFDAFCSKFGLKYYAQGGTLLGAVRHKGFIPWDDDVDVVMLWEDYKKLLLLAPEYFVHPFFFQSYLTEAEAEPTFSRLRRSDTTGCTKFELECITPSYNKGIFIDIFPLFDVPNEIDKKNSQIEEISYWWRLYKGYEVHREKELNGFSNLSKDYDQYEQLYLDSSMCFPEIKQKYVDSCSKYAGSTEYVAPLSFRANNPKTTWPRKWFDKIEFLPFEDLMLPCPKEYLEMLRFQYGDWETYVKNGAMHEMGIFDAEVPYDTKLNGAFVRDYFETDYEELKKLLHAVYDSNITRIELERSYLRENKFILVAIDHYKVVGCAFLSLKRDYVRDSFTSYVTYVAVDEAHRRKGIATKLFEEIVRRSKGYGCTAIELTSADFRIEAHNFYYSTGFTKKKTTVFIKELNGN